MLQYREHEAGSVARLPAHPLDQLVTQQVINALHQREETQAHATRLGLLSEQAQRQALRQMLERVVVTRNAVQITLNRSGESSPLHHAPDQAPEEESLPFTIDVPCTVVPRGGRQHLLVNGIDDAGKATPNAALVRAVVRGYHWRQQLLAGSPLSLKQFAHEQGVEVRYLMRFLRVSFLAPDILEAILNGTQPLTMTFERFRRPIPLEWAKQRALFGFPPR